MSVKAMSWVFDHSPYTLGARLIHLAIADIVNDDNDWLLWASKAKIADKAKVSPPTVTATFKRMVTDGYLELVEENTGTPSVYRFLRPTPQISEGSAPPDPPRILGTTPQISEPHPPSSPKPVLLPTQIEPNQTEASPIDELCLLLADKIEIHRGLRPEVTAKWHKDMDLLLRRGPLGVAGKPSLQPERVRQMILGIFAILAEPTGRRGFCWADQIRSPNALREHWAQCHQAGRQAVRAAQRRDPLATPQDIERTLLGGDSPLVDGSPLFRTGAQK